MHKIKQGALRTGTVKTNIKGTIKRFVTSDKAFFFMRCFKGASAYWKQFLYDVLAIVKQLEILTKFLT